MEAKLEKRWGSGARIRNRQRKIYRALGVAGVKLCAATRDQRHHRFMKTMISGQRFPGGAVHDNSLPIQIDRHSINFPKKKIRSSRKLSYPLNPSKPGINQDHDLDSVAMGRLVCAG